MSRVEIYAVRPNGDIEKYGEAQNAFGGAMHIWMALKDKYKTGGGILEGFTTLWQNIGKMSEVDQWVLASTFDNVMITKEHLPTLIRHLNTFMVEDAWSDTLAKEITILKQATRDKHVQAICFNQTSVNSNPWYVSSEDEEGEIVDERPYNINQDTGHWFLTPEYLKKRQLEWIKK